MTLPLHKISIALITVLLLISGIVFNSVFSHMPPMDASKDRLSTEGLTASSLTIKDLTVTANGKATLNFQNPSISSTPKPTPTPEPKVVPAEAKAAPLDDVKQIPAAASQKAAPVATSPNPVPAPAVPEPVSMSSISEIQQFARDTLVSKGLGDNEFTCLVNLWEKESNWNFKAENPSSGAYGIPQSLPGSKMASIAPDWMTNPQTQVLWGISYIEGRYKTPCGAWGHSVSVGWY